MKLKYIFLYLGPILLLVGGFWFGTKISSRSQIDNQVLASGSIEKFKFLSAQNTNKCGMVLENFDSLVDGDRIQGSCCSAMDLHRYQEQVEGLKKYSKYSVIPEDPYDIPVSLAKELFGYQKEINLTSEQQKIYDDAVNISRERGPCCCKCWRWSAFEGQSKYLIVNEGFEASQISELWDLQDGCGGPNHLGHT